MAARVSHTRDSTEVFLYPERPSKGKNRRLEAGPGGFYVSDLIEWIGLRENLQETMVFYHQI